MTKPARILLVEDNHMDVELLLDAFREACLNSNIYVVLSGQEALDYLFGHGQYADRQEYPLPDLILLDLKLPGIDGQEMLRQVKETPGLKRLPVIVLTSSKKERDRNLSYDNGANSYLVKPSSLDGFLEMTRHITDYWLFLNVGPPEWDAVT